MFTLPLPTPLPYPALPYPTSRQTVVDFWGRVAAKGQPRVSLFQKFCGPNVTIRGGEGLGNVSGLEIVSMRLSLELRTAQAWGPCKNGKTRRIIYSTPTSTLSYPTLQADRTVRAFWGRVATAGEPRLHTFEIAKLFPACPAAAVILVRSHEDRGCLFWDRPRVVYHRVYSSIRRSKTFPNFKPKPGPARRQGCLEMPGSRGLKVPSLSQPSGIHSLHVKPSTLKPKL